MLWLLKKFFTPFLSGLPWSPYTNQWRSQWLLSFECCLSSQAPSSGTWVITMLTFWASYFILFYFIFGMGSNSGSSAYDAGSSTTEINPQPSGASGYFKMSCLAVLDDLQKNTAKYWWPWVLGDKGVSPLPLLLRPVLLSTGHKPSRSQGCSPWPLRARMMGRLKMKVRPLPHRALAPWSSVISVFSFAAP